MAICGGWGEVEVRRWIGWPGSRCREVDGVVNLGWSRRVIASEHLFDIWLQVVASGVIPQWRRFLRRRSDVESP